MEATQSTQSWSLAHFGSADLGDARRTQRLVKVAQAMAEAPHQSLPEQLGDWASLKGGYRLLSHDQIDPRALNQPHCRITAEFCQQHPVVLAVQDDTHLAGKCDRMQHTTLAVTPDGQLLGMLDQRFFARPRPPRGEKRTEREARWRESQVWSESVKAVGSPGDCQVIHVADRAADEMDFMDACVQQQVSFVVRGRHDRRIAEGEADQKLFSYLQDQPELGRGKVTVGQHRDSRGRLLKRGRVAVVAVRSTPATLLPPWNHPGDHGPRPVQAVWIEEVDAPADVEPIQWMLLTVEPTDDLDAAWRVMEIYQKRWVIEEWHRALKEGCRVEDAQLNDPEDHLRQSAILSVVAVRLMQWRDLARDESAEADNPQALQRWAPPMWIMVVAMLAKVPPEQLTPRTFLRTIARKGGWLARNSDPAPGWKVLWRGWHKLQIMVQGAELAKQKALPN